MRNTLPKFNIAPEGWRIKKKILTASKKKYCQGIKKKILRVSKKKYCTYKLVSTLGGGGENLCTTVDQKKNITWDPHA